VFWTSERAKELLTGRENVSAKTFFEKIGTELEKLFKSTNWEQKAIAAVGYIAPLAETLVTLLAGLPAGTAVTNIVNQIKASIATVSVVAQDGTPAPGSTAAQTIESALTSINTNLGALLADAGVKNSAKVTEIEATANLITGETSALLASI
jgi:hypothetical protein